MAAPRAGRSPTGQPDSHPPSDTHPMPSFKKDASTSQGQGAGRTLSGRGQGRDLSFSPRAQGPACHVSCGRFLGFIPSPSPPESGSRHPGGGMGPTRAPSPRVFAGTTSLRSPPPVVCPAESVVPSWAHVSPTPAPRKAEGRIRRRHGDPARPPSPALRGAGAAATGRGRWALRGFSRV